MRALDWVAFTPDDRYRAWVLRDKGALLEFTSQLSQKMVHVWDPGAARSVAQLKLPSDWDPRSADLFFSPDGRFLVASSGKSPAAATVFEAASGQVLYRLGDILGNPAFSPDGRRMATAKAIDAENAAKGVPDVVQLRETATGQTVRGLAGNIRAAQAAFSPDGRWVVAVADVKGRPLRERLHESKVLIWDAATGAPGLTLAGGCDCLAFSPSGKRLVTGGPESGTIQVWDPATGQPVLVLRGSGNGPINHVAFSPDGSYLAAMDEARPVHRVTVWDATPLAN
jgi:WD40 repeat protein